MLWATFCQKVRCLLYVFFFLTVLQNSAGSFASATAFLRGEMAKQGVRGNVRFVQLQRAHAGQKTQRRRRTAPGARRCTKRTFPRTPCLAISLLSLILILVSRYSHVQFVTAVHTNLVCIVTRNRDVYRLDLYECKHKSDKLHKCEYLDVKHEQFMKRKLSLEVRKYQH